jgi:hypothetical protein
MQIGTYVIVVSVVLLIVNGPQEQDYGDASFHDLITVMYAWIWALILLILMLVAGFIVCFVDLQKRKVWFRFVVLLVARATAFSLNLTSGKALILPANKFWLIVNICIKVVSGIIYTKAIVVQSTAVEQKVFVPLNAAFIVFVNALTGIAIWRDFEVVQSWVGYTCVFLLLALGCGLLLGDLGLLQETSPETFRGARPSMFRKAERTKLLTKLKAFGTIPEEDGMDDFMSHSGDQEESITPSLKTPPQEVSPPINRRDQLRHSRRQRSTRSKAAWMSLYSQAANAHPRSTTHDNPHELIRWQSLRQQLELEMSASDLQSAGDLHTTTVSSGDGGDGSSFQVEKRTRFADEVAPELEKRTRFSDEVAPELEKRTRFSDEVAAEAAPAPPARMTSLEENANETDGSSSCCDVVESTNSITQTMDNNTDTTSDPKDSEKSYTSWSA